MVFLANFRTGKLVGKCRFRSENVGKCRKMSENVGKCRKMSENVEVACGGGTSSSVNWNDVSSWKFFFSIFVLQVKNV